MEMESDEKIPSLGNSLCGYFYSVAQCWATGMEEGVSVDNMGLLGRYLPTSGLNRFARAELRSAMARVFSDAEFRRLGSGQRWRPERIRPDTFVSFWGGMKGFVFTTLADALSKAGLEKRVDCPVLHFRCSDVPFVRHPGYHMPGKSYYEWCLERIGPTSELIILASYEHNIRDLDALAGASLAYTEFVAEVCSRHGINVTVRTESVLDDFSTLFHAPAVISTGSSFSFMSGFSSGAYFTCQCIEEPNRVIKANLPWHYPGLPLLHSQVADYFDFHTVIEQLRAL